MKHASDQMTQGGNVSPFSLLALVPALAFAVQLTTGWPLNARMNGPALFALQIYGTVVLSFAAGAGFALASIDNAGRSAQSVLAVLAAAGGWASMFLFGPSWSLLALAACFGVLAAASYFPEADAARPITGFHSFRPLIAGMALILAVAGALLPY